MNYDVKYFLAVCTINLEYEAFAERLCYREGRRSRVAGVYHQPLLIANDGKCISNPSSQHVTEIAVSGSLYARMFWELFNG